MKTIALLLTGILFTSSVLAGLPPTTLNSQQSGTKITTFNAYVPNNQATKVSGGTLIESGNNNILENPSFEHSTFDTGWIIGSGSSSEMTNDLDNTKVFHGLKSMKVTMAGGPMDIIAVSSVQNQAYKDGVQGLASIRVKTSVAGIKVCSRIGFATSTTNCVAVNTDGKWGLYKVPFIMGEFNNGLAVTSQAVSVTGDVYIDEAFAGAQGLTQDASQVLTQSSFLSSSATLSATAAVTGAATNTKGEGLFSYNSGTGLYTVLKKSVFNLSYGNRSQAGGSAEAAIFVNAVQAASDLSLASTGFSASSSYDNILNIGDTFQFKVGSSAANTHNVSITATESINNSTYSVESNTEVLATATRAANQALVSNVPTKLLLDTSLINIGGIVDIAASKFVIVKDGTYDLEAVTSWATGVSSNGRITLEIRKNGVLLRSTAHTGNSQGTAVTVTPALGIPLVTGDYIEVFVTQEISASFNVTGRLTATKRFTPSLITGSFNGIEKCADSYECTDTFSASVTSTGVVSEENIDFINGNCTVSDTSLFTCPYKTGLVTSAMNCSVMVFDANSTDAVNIKVINTSSSTQLVYRTGYNSTPPIITKSAYASKIICQKGPSDYIGKTAKAVASDQNVRSIGAVGVDVQSVYFGSGANCATACSTGNCAICKQVGSKITSVAFVSTGIYTVNGVDGLTKYSCSGSAFAGGNYGVINHDVVNSTSTTVRLNTGNGPSTVNAGYAHLTCIGIP
jgi:hypothetical protein